MFVDSVVDEASLPYDKYLDYFDVEDKNKVSDDFLQTGEPISAWEHSLIEVIDEFFLKWADQEFGRVYPDNARGFIEDTLD